MGVVLGAAVTGVALGVTIAFLFGIGTKNADRPSVAYPGSREASSEFEPPPKSRARSTRRAALPRLGLAPGVDFPDDRLPEIPASPRATPRQSAALPVAPVGLPPWRANAAHVVLRPGVPMIGIVIDDLGLDHGRTERALRLPAPVTLAFLSYGLKLKSETARARAAGHEILVHVPMEAMADWADPGPNALGVAMSAAEIRSRLDWVLTRFTGYVGINNHMGSKFTSNAAVMDVVLAELKARGLLFLDSRTAKTTVAYARARAAGVPAATRRVFLDRELTRAGVARQLAELESRARAKGHAIAIGHPHDVTLDVLEDWLGTLKDKGLQLAPVSALVDGGGAAGMAIESAR